VSRRGYEGANDLALLQAFNGAAIAETRGCGFIHPGDIAHRLFNGNKFFNPSELVTIWEDALGVAAWVLSSPRDAWFDAQVRPDRRTPDFELQILRHAENETVDLLHRHGIEKTAVEVEVYRCDELRSALLKELGWTRTDEEPYVLNRMRLDPIPDPQLPDGYSVRTVRGVEEAGPVSEVHASAFGSTWTPDLYRTVMEAPGYAADREFVVEAPDGALAAFTVTWHDDINRTGLFEPVGTHESFRRRGLGRGLLLHAMQEMAAAGMEYAIVVNEGENVGSRNLYRSVGFEPWHTLDAYTKPIPTTP
jgi:ribosomal protein S18 acetylase RimI-like enzyme